MSGDALLTRVGAEVREAEPRDAARCFTRLYPALVALWNKRTPQRLFFFLSLADEASQPSRAALNSSERNGAGGAPQPRSAPNPAPQQLPLLAVPARSRSADMNVESNSVRSFAQTYQLGVGTSALSEPVTGSK